MNNVKTIIFVSVLSITFPFQAGRQAQENQDIIDEKLNNGSSNRVTQEINNSEPLSEDLSQNYGEAKENDGGEVPENSESKDSGNDLKGIDRTYALAETAIKKIKEEAQDHSELTLSDFVYHDFDWVEAEDREIEKYKCLIKATEKIGVNKEGDEGLLTYLIMNDKYGAQILVEAGFNLHDTKKFDPNKDPKRFAEVKNEQGYITAPDALVLAGYRELIDLFLAKGLIPNKRIISIACRHKGLREKLEIYRLQIKKEKNYNTIVNEIMKQKSANNIAEVNFSDLVYYDYSLAMENEEVEADSESVLRYECLELGIDKIGIYKEEEGLLVTLIMEKNFEVATNLIGTGWRYGDAKKFDSQTDPKEFEFFQDEDGNITPPVAATVAGSVELIEALIRGGFIPDRRIIDIALGRDQKEVAAKLLSATNISEEEIYKVIIENIMRKKDELGNSSEVSFSDFVYYCCDIFGGVEDGLGRECFKLAAENLGIDRPENKGLLVDLIMNNDRSAKILLDIGFPLDDTLEFDYQKFPTELANFQDENGCITVPVAALWVDNTKLTELLAENGLIVYEQNIEIAIQTKNIDKVVKLLSVASQEIKDKYKEVPLDLLMNGEREAFKRLINAGFSVNISKKLPKGSRQWFKELADPKNRIVRLLTVAARSSTSGDDLVTFVLDQGYIINPEKDFPALKMAAKYQQYSEGFKIIDRLLEGGIVPDEECIDLVKIDHSVKRKLLDNASEETKKMYRVVGEGLGDDNAPEGGASWLTWGNSLMGTAGVAATAFSGKWLYTQWKMRKAKLSKK